VAILLFIISLLGIPVFLILALFAAFKKNGRAKFMFIGCAASFILLIVSALLNTPNIETASNDKVESNEAKTASTTSENLSEAKKAEEAEAKKKAEEAEAKKKAEEAEAKKKAEEAAKKAQEKPTFNVTWNQFKKNWSTIIPDIANTKIATITDTETTKQTGNNVINSKINDYILMMSDVDPETQKVKYVMLMAEPSSEDLSQNADILLAFGNLIANSNTSLSTSERGDILMKGLNFESGDLGNLDEEYQYKGVNYIASNMAGVLTLSIAPVK
jgi:hypothetical protein